MRKVAIVHDWLVAYSGIERVLEQLLVLFPDADLFCVCDFLPAQEREFLGGRRARTSFIQGLPGARRHFRAYLPLMPMAVEQLDLSGYDLVISSSHAVAKGVITGPDQLHVSYVHSPIRYAWDLQHQYLSEAGLTRGLKSWVARCILHRLRLWDVRTANGVDVFVANSKYIARRIRKTYRREAEVIYPPVNVDGFAVQTRKEPCYVVASRMVPYKRVDLVVEAFASMPDRRLVVIGDGPECRKIKAKATPNVDILGYQPENELREYLESAQAFVFAAEEDFGILPVEAQACGTPVIAYGRGGCTETVIDGVTGLFFDEQTAASIVGAVQRFEATKAGFDPVVIRRHAEQFSISRFREQFAALVERAWNEFKVV